MARRAAFRDDFDGPWKDVLERFFREFLELCAADVHRAVDWTVDPVFLMQELAALVPEETGRKGIVDLLAQVHLRSGACARILCHVEAQVRRAPDLERRLFRDHTRLFESKGVPIVTIALLLDRSSRWRPKPFDNRMFGSGCIFEFRTIKVRDWVGREAELERSSNPFSLVVLTWLELMKARSSLDRLQSKLRLARGLLERGLKHDVARDLLRFLWWIVRLPAAEEAVFVQEMRNMSKTQEDTYMLPWEREGWERGLQHGLEKGIEQGIEQGRKQTRRDDVVRILAARFGRVPDAVRLSLEQIGDSGDLDRLIDAAAVAENLDAFTRALPSTGNI